MNLTHAPPADLSTLLGWVPNAEACRLWGGPNVRYPMTLGTLQEDVATDDRVSYYLIGEEGEPVAFGQLVHVVPECRRLSRLIVVPQRRGEGLGALLCYRLIERACRERSVETVSLNVYRENRRARVLYEGLGFEEEGEERPGVLHMRASARQALLQARLKAKAQR